MLVSVVVPTYCEADNVVEVIERLRQVLADIGRTDAADGDAPPSCGSYEIVIVDDDSPDETWRVAREHADGDPAVRVIRRVGERGLAAAVAAGMAASVGETLAVIDGDLQHDETILPEMIAQVASGAVDVCVGARANEHGGFGHSSRLRGLLTNVGARLVQSLLPLLARTSDPLSGYFVISRSVYERCIPAPGSRLREYKILWAFCAQGADLAVGEIGYEFRPRTAGATKLSAAVLLDDLANACALRVGRVVSPEFLKYCLVGASGVAVSVLGYGAGRLAGLRQVTLHLRPGRPVGPGLVVSLPALLGIEASIVTNFFANNHLTFHDRRYRGWGVVRGLGVFHLVSAVGLSAGLSLLRLLRRRVGPSQRPADLLSARERATLSSALSLALSACVNFALNASITWRRPSRSSTVPNAADLL